MKRGTLILALCGAVATAGLGFAQEGFRLTGKPRADQSSSKSAVQYFSRSGKNSAVVESTTKSTADSSKSAFQLQKKATPGKSPSADVIRAEYNQRFGQPLGGTIKTISSANAGSSPFAPAESAPKAGAFPVKSARPMPAASPVAAKAVPAAVQSGPQTAMVTVKWVKLSDINVGLECECGLVVKNDGKVAAERVAVVAAFPTNVRLTSAKPMPQELRGQLLWKFESLAPGEKQMIRVKLIPSRRGPLTTNASVRFTSAAAETFTVAEPMLKLTMTGQKNVLIGDSASQIINVSNPGTGIATNVTIEARIPKGLEHPRGERLTMEIGSLNPGESRKVRLSLSAAKGGNQTIYVQATSDVALKQQLSRDVLVVAPSVKVAMKGPGLRYLGRNAVYAISVTNDGTGATNNVRVLHRVPDGFKYVRSDKGGKYDSATRTLSWFVGRVEPGQSVDVKVELTATKLGDHTHLAGAISEQGAKSEASFKTKVDGTASLVLDIVDLDDPVEVGAETAYEVRVRNSGTKSASKVSLSCELPPGVTLVNAKGPTSSIAENGLIVFKAVGELAPGKTAIYRIQVRGTKAGNQRFRARLASESIQNPLTFEELTKFYVD